MNKEELTLEEAENIVDNMYQNRWKECGIEDGNIIHMGNLEKLHYSQLERASILLLRTEMRLKRENQELKKQLEVGEQQYNDLVEEKEGLQEQLDYLRSGEYLNQLRFERDMLQDIVDKGEVSKEDKEFIDCIHRNTELLEENKQLKVIKKTTNELLAYLDKNKLVLNNPNILEFYINVKKILDNKGDEK